MSHLDERIQSAKQNPIQVPDAVSARIDKTLAELPKQRRKPKWVISTAAAAVLLFIVLIGSSYLSPVMAKSLSTIPVIGSLFSKVGDVGLRNASQQGMTSPLHASIETPGASLAFEGVVYDGNRLSVSYVVKPNSAKKWSEKEISSFLGGLSFQVNGKPLNNYSLSERGQMIHKGEYAGAVTLVTASSLPDHFQLKIHVHKLGTDSGNWSAQFPVKKVSGHSFLLHQTKTAGKRTIRMNKITFGATSTDVSFELKEPKSMWGLDNKGNANLSYELFDDHGRRLQSLSSGGAGGSRNGIMTSIEVAQFEPLNRLPKYLIFQPVEQVYSKKPAVKVKKSLNGKLPLKLSQGKDGYVTITNLAMKNGESKLTFRINGKDPIVQANAIWLVDGDGKSVYPKKTAKRLKASRNLFQLTFNSVDPEKKWSVETVKMLPPKILKGLRFKIQIH